MKKHIKIGSVLIILLLIFISTEGKKDCDPDVAKCYQTHGQYML